MLLVCSTLFVILILLSIARPKWNPGYPAFFLALTIAPLTSTPSASNPFALFPDQLFLTLLGVTFFFVGLNSRGLISAIVLTLFQRAEKNPRLIPPAVFVLVALLTAVGIGNIATVAIIAPLAIPLASKLKISPLVMTILVVGGANAASFSPLTLPGILTHNFIHRTEFLQSHPQFYLMHWWTFWLVFICISATTFISYKILHKRQARIENAMTIEKPLELQLRASLRLHWLTLVIAGLIALLFVLANLFSIRAIAEIIPLPLGDKLALFKNVGVLGWLGSAILVFSGHFKLRDDLKRIPWGTIALVCGMSTYIELLSELGLTESIAHFTEKNAPQYLLASVFAGISGVVSAFSSSVGVALPMFLPIIESISQTLVPSVSAVLVYSVAIGSHLVDASPLSTLGALCLSQVTNVEVRNDSYRSLLIYSFIMIPVAGLWGYALYLLLT
ncbi:MAG: hypothetical protein RJB13_1641 [Pseudomonadota bacterium]